MAPPGFSFWPAVRQTPPSEWPALVRSKDIRYHPYFRGGISRGTWRFFAYRFTRPGLWLLLVTVILGSYGSNTLQMQGYVPFLYLTGLWLVASLGVRLFRPRVTLTARHAARIAVGERLPLEIEIETRRRFNPAELNVVPHELPPPLDAIPDEGIRTAPLERGKQQTLRLSLRCRRRGVFRWPGFRVETEFPLGLIRSFQTVRQAHQVLVYPHFTPLSRLHIAAGRRYHPGGVALASQVGESFEFVGSREYREGDDIRHLDWRATARLNAPIVREYREEYLMRVAVILDTQVPDNAGLERREDMERAVSLGAAVSDFMARSDYLVDLFAAGAQLYHLLAGRSLASLDQILDILACVEPQPDAPFAQLEPELMAHLAQITTVVCVFLDWDDGRQAFVQRLLREGTGGKGDCRAGCALHAGPPRRRSARWRRCPLPGRV